MQDLLAICFIIRRSAFNREFQLVMYIHHPGCEIHLMIPRVLVQHLVYIKPARISEHVRSAYLLIETTLRRINLALEYLKTIEGIVS